MPHEEGRASDIAFVLLLLIVLTGAALFIRYGLYCPCSRFCACAVGSRYGFYSQCTGSYVCAVGSLTVNPADFGNCKWIFFRRKVNGKGWTKVVM